MRAADDQTTEQGKAKILPGDGADLHGLESRLMKVLITSVPGFGHLCPVIPLAQALQIAGHDVAIATSAAMQPLLADAGVSLLPSGPYWLESDFSHTLANSQSVPGYRNDLSEHLEKTVTPKLLDDVLAHTTEWTPDVIMSNDFEISGRIAAEKLQIPFVLMSSGPRLPQMLRRQWHGPLFLKARALAGLPATDPLEYSLRWLHLCFTPEWYAFKSSTPYQVENLEYGIRPAVFDAFGQWKLNRSPVVRQPGLNIICTLGTVFDKDARILERIIGGVQELEAHVWITQNIGAPGLDSASLPGNVHILSGTQLSAQMRFMDICISHGGTSTLTTAMINGVRNLIIPQGADQIINAIACTQHRLAMSLMSTVVYDENPDEGRIGLSPRLVSEALAQLDDETFRTNAVSYQDSIRDLPDMDYAVLLIEQLATTKKPVRKTAGQRLERTAP